jgi:hypothetical protein
MRRHERIVVDANALVSRLLLPSSVPGQAVRKAVYNMPPLLVRRQLWLVRQRSSCKGS